ncbi:MAG: hypothetical protein QUV05_14105 [Phycisphaerae bacterium]|jgi:hypothetical protein|nr:hypothetical protein [Phycisphaerae bacterium]
MRVDSDQSGQPPNDPMEQRGDPSDRSFTTLVFVIYGALMLMFHPGCVGTAFRLRHMPSPYRNIYCFAMIVLVVRGLISSEKILFWLGVVAALMFITALLMPTLS